MYRDSLNAEDLLTSFCNKKTGTIRNPTSLLIHNIDLFQDFVPGGRTPAKRYFYFVLTLC
jgi:hypothetical protein